MRKEWIDPNAIYLAKPINPRPMNQGFIESLRESMLEQGFLPQYPVKVFEVGGLTCVETDLQYACVSGMHRTTAAQHAKIDQILCEIYTGDDDAFIEMMMTDNFEYDPARNSELGQIFSQREKRKACQRLLYIPKFLRMTNSALADEWHTNEANIRRWRKEIVTSLDVQEASSNGEGGAPTFPETLSRVGITPERLQELKDINGSREREDAEGNTVQVRKPRADASDDDKDKFFEEIRLDFSVLREESDIDFDWNDVKTYCGQKWDIQVGWQMCRNMHMDQLRKLHKMLLEQDADLMAACTEMSEKSKALSASREGLEKACKKTKRVFCKLIDADNEWDSKFKSKWTTFEKLVKAQLDIETFGNARWDYSDLETAEEFQAVIAQHETVHEAIKNESDWIAEFMKKEAAAAVKRRENVSKNWTAKRVAAIAAINDYPRDVSFDRIVSEADDEFYKSRGYFNKIFDAETVSAKKNVGTLEDEIKSLDRLINAVKEDENWVSKIPETRIQEKGVTIQTVGDIPDADIEKATDKLITASDALMQVIDEKLPWYDGDKGDYRILCDRAAHVLACDREILWMMLWNEDCPETFGIADLAKWEMILRQIHAAIEAKSEWIMAVPGDSELPAYTASGSHDPDEVDADGESTEQPPEFTITADDLHAISLEDIFQHVADRVIHIPVDDENEVMVDMATLLGKASRGQRGTQLYLLMKFALFLQPKSDIEGVEIEKEEGHE